MHSRLLLRSICLALLSLGFGGCASVSVKDVGQSQDKDAKERPARFAVMPFEVNPNGVKQNPMRKNPGKLAEETRALLHAALVVELKKLGLPVDTKTSGKAGTWTVVGNVTRVSEGSRVLRMGVGLGLGGTKMETAVAVKSGSSTVLKFATTGGSNATPGAATTPIPFSSVPAALINAKDGVTADASRTARMIALTIADYMSRRGWLAGTWEKPKMAR